MITEVLIGLTVIALAVIFFYFFPYIFLQAIGLIPYIAYKQIHKIRLIRDAHFFVTSKGNIEFVMKVRGPVVLYIHGHPVAVIKLSIQLKIIRC